MRFYERIIDVTSSGVYRGNDTGKSHWIGQSRNALNLVSVALGESSVETRFLGSKEREWLMLKYQIEAIGLKNLAVQVEEE